MHCMQVFSCQTSSRCSCVIPAHYLYQPSPGRTTFFFHHSAMSTISPSPITTAAHRHAQRHTTKRARRQQCATMYIRQHIMQAGHGQPQNGLLLLLLLHHKRRAKASMTHEAATPRPTSTPYGPMIIQPSFTQPPCSPSEATASCCCCCGRRCGKALAHWLVLLPVLLEARLAAVASSPARPALCAATNHQLNL